MLEDLITAQDLGATTNTAMPLTAQIELHGFVLSRGHGGEDTAAKVEFYA